MIFDILILCCKVEYFEKTYYIFQVWCRIEIKFLRTNNGRSYCCASPWSSILVSDVFYWSVSFSLFHLSFFPFGTIYSCNKISPFKSVSGCDLEINICIVWTIDWTVLFHICLCQLKTNKTCEWTATILNNNVIIFFSLQYKRTFFLLQKPASINKWLIIERLLLRFYYYEKNDDVYFLIIIWIRTSMLRVY
jgi:hypothetical protein